MADPRICQRRMNPCDCVFHGFDYLLRLRGYGGTSTFMIAELAGSLTPEAVRSALGRAMERHSVLAGAATVSRWRAWPCWTCRDDAVPPHVIHADLRGQKDWLGEADELCQDRLSSGWDPAQPPQARIELYSGPGRSRLCLRWPHALMDAEGAQLLLAEMDRLADDPARGLPAALLPDDARVNLLAGLGPLRRCMLLLRRAVRRRPPSSLRGSALPMSLPGGPAGSRRLRYLVRSWSSEATARMQARAREVTPVGPALYSRYLAACTLRAADCVHKEHGRQLLVCGLMFPIRMPGLTARPLPGNYLVAAPLLVAPERLGDRRALGSEIARQLQYFRHTDGARSTLALQRLLAQLRVGQYRRLLGWENDRQPFITGFSFYGEIDPPLRRLLGAEVTNLYGGGVISIPPAWNVTFSRFADRISLVVAWPDEVFPQCVVERYAELIEREALGAPPE